jgi:hypothetical protein
MRDCCAGHGYVGYDERGRPVPCPTCLGFQDRMAGRNEFPNLPEAERRKWLAGWNAADAK